MTLEPPAAGRAPAVAFVQPDASWQERFDQASMRVLLVLLEQALECGASALMVLTVQEHHATVRLVIDREPQEIAKINLRYYDGMRGFLRDGLFASSTQTMVRYRGSSYRLLWEFVDQLGGEGFQLSIGQVIAAV